MSERTKVLCVDDHQDTAETTGRLLEAAGCEARWCYDGATALALAQAFQPDVCVLDLGMPGLCGEELAGRLREQAGGRRIRFIALTGRWDIGARHNTHNAGFEEHLVKAVPPERLVEAVTGRRLAGGA